MLAGGVLRWGPLRISPYGLCAALGLLTALWLSGRTARLRYLEPAALWDAGVFALTAAFVLSRALLVIRNHAVFLQYPLIVLSLPSFTYLGMALTAIALLVYLLQKKLPILQVLDAWAPCAALLAAFLELGHWLDGSDPGMPWLPGYRLVPVHAIGVGAAALLSLYLVLFLKRTPRVGVPAASGMFAGAALAFVLSMLTQPAIAGSAWLEPGQYIALAAMLLGSAIALPSRLAHRT
jgi:phosphatidylglycerol:prolipoprotein diacylglycerol transferase